MKKGILLAAVACVAMFALPAVASAGPWHVQNGTIGFSGTGGAGNLTSAGGTTIDCSSVTVTGAYETTTTGWIDLTYHGCFATAIFNPHCQTGGDSTGTITTTKLTFHNILLEGNAPGILLTPNDTTNKLGDFSCFGIVTKIIGNGLLGALNRKCGEKSSSATATFTSIAAGVPSPTKVTGSGTEYTLETLTQGVTRMASKDASWSLNFAGDVEQTIDCTL